MTHDTSGSRFRARGDVERIDSAGESILIDSVQDRVHKLNQSAVEIYELAQGRTIPEIVQGMSERHAHVARGRLAEDVQVSVDLLLSLGLLEYETP